MVASIIFKVVDGDAEGLTDERRGKNGVAWVLRFGGLMALVGLDSDHRRHRMKTRSDLTCQST